jgi:arginine/lysine/ornithine decarboxylase
MQQTPLYQALRAYLQRDAARFHMPGHKGAAFPPFGECLAFDITEVAGADSLFEADGPLLQTEEALASLYGARRTLLSAGGSTLCIQTMLALAAGEGQKVIAGRNLHLAAVNAMALLGVEPVFVYPDGSSGAGIGGGLSRMALEAALREHPDVAAVYITSPDYFGVLSDIPALAALCRAHGVPLLVDNAMGRT